jgi:hypothetical protein
MDNNKFEEFIKDSISQKEISLILAKDDDELAWLKDKLAKNNYIFPANILVAISELNSQDKTCFEIKDESEAKELYDFAMQYPTGQINMFDEKTMKNIISTPDYNNKSIIFLATEDQLKKLRHINFDFFAISGIAYRNKE